MLYLIKVVGFKVGTKGNRKAAYRIGTGIHEHICVHLNSWMHVLDEISVEAVNLQSTTVQNSENVYTPEN